MYCLSNIILDRYVFTNLHWSWTKMRLESRISVRNAVLIISTFSIVVFLLSIVAYNNFLKTDKRNYYELNIEELKDKIGINSKDDDAILEMAMAKYLNGQSDDALAVLSLYLNKKPPKIKALLYAGLIYVDINRYKDSIPLLNEVVRLNPNYERELLYYNLGLAYFKTGDYQNSVKNLKIAASVDPGHAMANFYLGQAYFKVGQYKNAKLFLSNTLKLDANIKEAVDLLDYIDKNGLDK